MSRIIDISQTLRPGIAVWPGDTPFENFWVMRIDRGDECNVGSVTMSLHTGTHVDAPFHVLADAGDQVDRNLDVFIGPATVVDLSGTRTIDAEHVRAIADHDTRRILFRTGTFDPDHWDDDFAHVTAEAARGLMERGVRLVGIDTPSVDSARSADLAAHRIFASAGIIILENLNLTHVAPGPYELIALPLKLDGMDASPVRALLRCPA